MRALFSDGINLSGLFIPAMKPNLLDEVLKAHSGILPEVVVNVISKRVRQINAGAKPLVRPEPKDCTMDVALREMIEGKLSFEIPSGEALEALKPKPPKKRRRKS